MTREEAIEIVKKNWPEGRHQIKEALEFLVPELKESDDERMIAAIKQAVKLSSQEGGFLINNITREEALAWLEKQKPVEWSDEDELMLNSIIDVLKLTNGAAQMKIDWLKSLRPQPKQEWSEEDKDRLNRIYGILGLASDTHAYSTTCRLIGDKEAIELQDFLKSIIRTKKWKPTDKQMYCLARASNRCVSIDDAKTLTKLYEELEKFRP